MEDIRLWLWYTIAMGGHKALARKLYKDAGSIKKLYEFTKSDYIKLGLTNEKKIEDLSNKSFDEADKTLWYASKYNVKFLTIDGKDYPEALKHIDDPPLLLYTRGVSFTPNDRLCIAIGGTSNPTETGRKVAYNLAKELAASGVMVIGGMSPGIESCAHAGCLDGGGETVAVMAGGVNNASKASTEFMRRIMNSGAVISEVGFDEPTYNGRYAQRNRIIAGLSMGTVTVEAGQTSGSLVIPRFALEYNRDVFAVPGKVGEETSVGTNELIKSGAKAVTKAEDILEEYAAVYPHLIKTGPFSQNEIEFDVPQSGSVETNIENTILSYLKGTPRRADELINLTKLPVGQFNGALTMLELTGKVEKSSDGYYKIVD